jgi:hypothetical protein
MGSKNSGFFLNELGRRIPLASGTLGIMMTPALEADGIGDFIVFAGALTVVVGERLRWALVHGISGKAT